MINEEKFNNIMIKNELKNKFSRCIQYSGEGKYIYRGIIIDVKNDIIYLHYNTNKNYTRNVRNTYTLFIEDNELNNNQLKTIFTNLEYIFQVIKKRLLNIFNDGEYENIENGFEFKYNRNNNSFIIEIEYQIIDKLTVNYKNEMVSEIIIGVLLDAAEELNNNDFSSSIVIDGGDIKFMGEIL